MGSDPMSSIISLHVGYCMSNYMIFELMMVICIKASSVTIAHANSMKSVQKFMNLNSSPEWFYYLENACIQVEIIELCSPD